MELATDQNLLATDLDRYTAHYAFLMHTHTYPPYLFLYMLSHCPFGSCGPLTEGSKAETPLSLAIGSGWSSIIRWQWPELISTCVSVCWDHT